MFAIINDGIVENLIKCDPDFAQSIGAIETTEGVDIGDAYDSVNGFSKINTATKFSEIRPAYFYIALELLNLKGLVEEALNLPENKLIKIIFEKSLSFERNDARLNDFSKNVLMLNDNQIDDVFKQAMEIQGY